MLGEGGGTEVLVGAAEDGLVGQPRRLALARDNVGILDAGDTNALQLCSWVAGVLKSSHEEPTLVTEPLQWGFDTGGSMQRPTVRASHSAVQEPLVRYIHLQASMGQGLAQGPLPTGDLNGSTVCALVLRMIVRVLLKHLAVIAGLWEGPK